jgi:hypothetical protein
MKRTKLMERIYSANKNQESEILDNFYADVESAMSGELVNTDQYSIFSDEEGTLIHDKINNELTSIHANEGEYKMEPWLKTLNERISDSAITYSDVVATGGQGETQVAFSNPRFRDQLFSAVKSARRFGEISIPHYTLYSDEVGNVTIVDSDTDQTVGVMGADDVEFADTESKEIIKRPDVYIEPIQNKDSVVNNIGRGVGTVKDKYKKWVGEGKNGAGWTGAGALLGAGTGAGIGRAVGGIAGGIAGLPVLHPVKGFRIGKGLGTVAGAVGGGVLGAKFGRGGKKSKGQRKESKNFSFMKGGSTRDRVFGANQGYFNLKEFETRLPKISQAPQTGFVKSNTLTGQGGDRLSQLNNKISSLKKTMGSLLSGAKEKSSNILKAGEDKVSSFVANVNMKAAKVLVKAEEDAGILRAKSLNEASEIRKQAEDLAKKTKKLANTDLAATKKQIAEMQAKAKQVEDTAHQVYKNTISTAKKEVNLMKSQATKEADIIRNAAKADAAKEINVAKIKIATLEKEVAVRQDKITKFNKLGKWVSKRKGKIALVGGGLVAGGYALNKLGKRDAAFSEYNKEKNMLDEKFYSAVKAARYFGGIDTPKYTFYSDVNGKVTILDKEFGKQYEFDDRQYGVAEGAVDGAGNGARKGAIGGAITGGLLAAGAGLMAGKGGSKIATALAKGAKGRQAAGLVKQTMKAANNNAKSLAIGTMGRQNAVVHSKDAIKEGMKVARDTARKEAKTVGKKWGRNAALATGGLGMLGGAAAGAGGGTVIGGTGGAIKGMDR